MKQQDKGKILIIGLDGVPWNILEPYLERGVMPHLQKLRSQGCAGTLESTEPPITPTAWTTFMTGVLPHRHQINSWEHLDLQTHELHVNNSHTIAVETIWSYLSRQGYRVAVLNLPQCYPPSPVNGIMTAGYGSPGVAVNYTYPVDFKDKIKQAIPNFDILLKWDSKDLGPDENFYHALDCCNKSFHNSQKLVELADSELDWDILMVQIHQTDMMLHKMWRILEPEYWQEHPDREKPLLDMMQKLDESIAAMCQLAAGPRDTVMILSDHGQGPTLGFIRPNVMLKEWGYLKSETQLTRLGRHLRPLLPKSLQKGADLSSSLVSERVKFDGHRSRAFVGVCVIHGAVYLNLKDRQPHGVVEPGTEAERLLDEIKRRFEELDDPLTSQKLFQAVLRPQELYGPEVSSTRFGDLILIPAEGYEMARNLRGPAIDTDARHAGGGTHRPGGMLVVYGPHLAKTTSVDANIVDVAPTLYALLGVEPPYAMDGRVLNDLFVDQRAPEPTRPVVSEGKISQQESGQDTAFSEEEEKEIYNRLADLGYTE